MRKDAFSIYHVGLKGADAADALLQHLQVQAHLLIIDERTYDLSAYNGVYVVGAGKASGKMAQVVETLLGDRIKGGVVNVKCGCAVPLKSIKINEAGHPLPDQAGMQGAEEIVDLLRRSGDKDLVLCLISGGGSALLPYPLEGLTLQNKQAVTGLLLECGATIYEINAVRKHLSQVKGGRLARFAYPSTVVSLILSDVVGDDLDCIASGPTVPDRSTFRDCLRILNRYGIEQVIPSPVRKLLEKGAVGQIEETPKADDLHLQQVENVIVGNNGLAMRAAKRRADQLGYHSLILSSFITGETREVAKVHVAVAREILATGHPVRPPACIISGGETTVTLRGRGLGGRNQEFALAAAVAMEGLERVIVLSGGTDGTDGPTDAAGAIVDGETLRKAKGKGLSGEQFLQDNDSYHFFQMLGDLLITGPTYTNVMDLRLVLVS